MYMNKIIISYLDYDAAAWAVHKMVALLMQEGVPIGKIHKDAMLAYYLMEYLNGLYYYGYADLLLKSKGDRHILGSVNEGLKCIGAYKHLSYIQQQAKVVAGLPEEEYAQWYYSYPAFGLIDSKLLTTLKGEGYKEVSEREGLNALASKWLSQLPHFEVTTLRKSTTIFLRLQTSL